LVRSCFLEPNCTGILVWGIRDNDSWIPYFFYVTPYLLYNNAYAQNGSYNAQGVVTKGAWTGFRDGVAGLPDATFPAASLVGNGNPGTGVNPGSETYTIRARGIVGGEQIQLQINGVVKATFTLTTTLQDYAIFTNTGTARVVFINDEGARDVVVDYLKVGNTIIQSENQVINTAFYSNGRCGGGSNNETMHCNGYIEYAGSDGYKTYTVRARGTAGGEQIQLQINGVVKTTFTLTTAFHDYTLSTNAGTVRVAFINDDGTKDVIVDYIKVGNTTIQSENQAINTGFYTNGSCGGGSNNETLHCNGYIEYAGSAASARESSEENELINEEPIISISPNPAENTINMVVGAEFIGGELYIIDQMGLPKMKTSIPNAEFQVNISPLKTGVYITKVVSEGGKIGTKKLIIK
jgi:Secretion system C-terminal sorting domain